MRILGTCISETAQSGVLDMHVHCVVKHMQMGRCGAARTMEPCSWLWPCESFDFAYFTSDCDAPQLYTDAAPVKRP